MYRYEFISLSLTIKKIKVSKEFMNVNLVIILMYIIYNVFIYILVFVTYIVFKDLEDKKM